MKPGTDGKYMNESTIGAASVEESLMTTQLNSSTLNGIDINESLVTNNIHRHNQSKQTP